MKRRELLKATVLGSSAALAVMNTKNSNAHEANDQADVLIVGAGNAGIPVFLDHLIKLFCPTACGFGLFPTLAKALMTTLKSFSEKTLSMSLSFNTSPFM